MASYSRGSMFFTRSVPSTSNTKRGVMVIFRVGFNSESWMADMKVALRKISSTLAPVENNGHAQFLSSHGLLIVLHVEPG